MHGRQVTHVILDEADALQHYGIIRRSGRYPWGSGGNYGNGSNDTVVQRSRSFIDLVEYLRKKLGLTETQAAEYVGMTTTQLRATKTIAKAQLKSANIAYAQRLKDKGLSNTAIGEKMGINESSVRELLAPGAKDRSDQLTSLANILRGQVDEYGFTDVGRGVDAQLNVADTKLKTALAILESEGYVVNTVKVKQLGTGEFTEIRVLGPPGSTQREMWESTKLGNLHTINVFSEDGGRTNFGIQPPLSIDSDRIAINWAEDGGTEADGVMYIRPGVKDVSIGKSRYAQVRVAVDGTHYIKGMAIYKDDLPDGVDILFNTNKSDDGSGKLSALKPMKDDPDNPFGSQFKRQIIELDADGKERVTSVMNIVSEEGDWDNWSRTLSSQMLSKQDKRLAQEQLDMMYDRRRGELEDIMALTNPVIKERLLKDFSETVDSAAVHLKAAAMPRQRNSVILPVPSLKDGEIYAPNFNNGERVVLIRHPHGGTFEIPELVVNNRNRTAKSILGQAEDAVGINAKVAQILSGADFDGDTVLVIPNDRGSINTSPQLKALVDFDAKRDYKLPDSHPGVKERTKQIEMGKISNLITDMTIMGASQAELAQAVKHSQVVIDAEKHRLDISRSARDHGIPQLKEKYLGRADAGASTLISRAGSKDRDYPKMKPRPASEGGPIDPKTGKLVMVPDLNLDGTQKRTTVKRLAVTDDAFTLSSGTPIERVYATHSNKMKALANQARKEMVATKPRPYDPEAKKKYAKEVDELDAALRIAKLNAPRERKAQVVANAIYTQKKQAHPEMSAEDKKKVRGQALTEARLRTGASKTRIDLTPRQWEAIQAGAVSTSKLKDIITNSDLDRLKELATPRTRTLMNSTKIARAKSMAASGYTQAEIAQALGVGLTTLKEGLAGD